MGRTLEDLEDVTKRCPECNKLFAGHPNMVRSNLRTHMAAKHNKELKEET